MEICEIEILIVNGNSIIIALVKVYMYMIIA